MPITSATGRKLTYRDLARIPEDGLRHEILDGKHYVSPAPALRHQFVSGRLFRQLDEQVTDSGLGVVFHAPADVELARHDIVEPDLFVVLGSAAALREAARYRGTPALVVEILSPSTRRRDLGLKKRRYQLAGVPEYWIVDPVRETVTQCVLRAGVYVVAGTHGERLVSAALPRVSIDLRRVWKMG